VPALEAHLRRVEAAEQAVREQMGGLGVQRNLRVRMLAGERAVVEVDAEALDRARGALGGIEAALRALGFSSVGVRAFRSGSLSGAAGGPAEGSASAVAGGAI
jgi:PP-loop superfamily ATP-utilizing enzyme